MKRRTTWAAAGLAAVVLLSCTTNPITPATFDVDRPPPDATLAITLSLVPGGPQIANGEYLEAAALMGVFAGSVVATAVSVGPSPSDPSTYAPKPGFEALGTLGIAGIVGSILYNVVDSLGTTMQRQSQFSAIGEDPAVLSELVLPERFDAAPLYAIRYASYGNAPSGTLRLRNLGSSRLRQVEVFAEGSFLSAADQPVARLAELGPRSYADIPLTLRFDPSVAALTEDRTLALKMTVSFRLGRIQSRSTVSRVVVLGRNALSWDNLPALASFVQPRDPPIETFAREAVTRAADMAEMQGVEGDDPTFRLQVLAAALETRGLSWFPDPVTPFRETSQGKDLPDTIQLPRETLRFLGGDADEIALLLCSLSEAAGMETAVLFRPGQILAAIRLGAGSPYAARLRSLDSGSAREWAVIDPRRMPDKLANLIDAGTTQLDGAGAAGFQFVRIRSAWAAYPPAVLPDTSWRAEVPSIAELTSDMGSP